MLNELFRNLSNKLSQKWQIYQFRRTCKKVLDQSSYAAIQRSKIAINLDLKMVSILCRDSSDYGQVFLVGCYQIATVADHRKLKRISILAPEKLTQTYSVKLAFRALKIDLQWEAFNRQNLG